MGALLLAIILLLGGKGHATPLVTATLRAGASSYAPGHQAGDAIGSGHDGGTSWVAAPGAQFPQWLTIDLGAIYDISNVKQTFAAADFWRFKIEGSNDDELNDAWWTTLADHSNGAQGKSFADPVTGSFRYLRIYITGAGTHSASSLQFGLTARRTAQTSAAVPPPVPVATPGVTIGVQACNLWANKQDWLTLVPYQDRISNLGYYNEAYDIATDWQIKAAVEHGIGFMQSCWYRQAGNDGNSPIMSSYDQFINSIAVSARYRSLLKWDIDWINNQSGVGGVSGPEDFTRNLVPFWITTYFAKPNYLKINGRPVLAIADFEGFIKQMGGLVQAHNAIASFRNQVVAAGYPGLLLLTQEVQSTTPASHWMSASDPRVADVKFGNFYTHDYTHINSDAAAAGFDNVFSYHLPTFSDLMVSPTPSDAQAIGEQVQTWSNWLSYSMLPTIVTASVGWNAAPWGEAGASWHLTAADWAGLLGQARSAMAARHSQGTSGLLLLDNWNEYGEGHYIAPTRKDGFSYLDAITSAYAPKRDANAQLEADVAPDAATVPQVLYANGSPAP